jgi:leucyl aminopeptidase (aminopeptidase T)
VEGSANGRIVFDGSGPAFGGSLIATIVDGYAVSFEGPAAPSFRALIEPHGHEARAVAEFGIGTNDHARVTGELLEDEKVLGTVHLAFGDNHSFGGAVRVDFHLDQVILHPEVSLDGTVVLSSGRLRT